MEEAAAAAEAAEAAEAAVVAHEFGALNTLLLVIVLGMRVYYVGVCVYVYVRVRVCARWTIPILLSIHRPNPPNPHTPLSLSPTTNPHTSPSRIHTTNPPQASAS